VSAGASQPLKHERVPSNSDDEYLPGTPQMSPDSSYGTTPSRPRPSFASLASFTTSCPAQPPVCNQEQQKVPRPPNCFILYRSDYHKSHRLAAHESGSDLSKNATRAWKQISKEERAFWERMAAQKAKEHQAMYPGYKFRPQQKSRKVAASLVQKKSSKKASATAKARKPRHTRCIITLSPIPVVVQAVPAAVGAPPIAKPIATSQLVALQALDPLDVSLPQFSSPTVSSLSSSNAIASVASPSPTFSLDDQLIVLPSPGTESSLLSDDYLPAHSSGIIIDAGLDYSLMTLGSEFDYSLMPMGDFLGHSYIDTGLTLPGTSLYRPTSVRVSL
jgi:hypothetical protein